MQQPPKGIDPSGVGLFLRTDKLLFALRHPSCPHLVAAPAGAVDGAGGVGAETAQLLRGCRAVHLIDDGVVVERDESASVNDFQGIGNALLLGELLLPELAHTA